MAAIAREVRHVLIRWHPLSDYYVCYLSYQPVWRSAINRFLSRDAAAAAISRFNAEPHDCTLDLIDHHEDALRDAMPAELFWSWPVPVAEDGHASGESA